MAYEQTPLRNKREISYYKNIFDNFDSNRDGHLDYGELKALIEDQGLTISKKTLNRIMNEADSNNDHLIDFDEFYAMLHDPVMSKVFHKYVKTYLSYFMIPKQKGKMPPMDEIDGIGAYEKEMCHWPPKFLGMTFATIIIIVCFVIDEVREPGSNARGKGYIGEHLIFDPKNKEEFWRYFTYGLVHTSYSHLIVNSLFQVFLGVPLEMFNGWWRVLLLYCVGIIAGSIATAITDPYILLAGASGGVYALITAHIAAIIMNWHEMTRPVIVLVTILVFVCYDMGMSIYTRFFSDVTSSSSQIGYVAHFAGAAAGLFVGISVLKNLVYTTKEKYCWWGAVIVFTLLMAVGIACNIANITFT